MSDTIKIFISYAREDMGIAKKLYHDLKNAGVTPWMDMENLLPGQQWESEIDKAIKESSYFLLLLSSHSVTRSGVVNKEIRKALGNFQNFMPDKLYIIPARIDDYKPAYEELYISHWVDLFPSYDEGLTKILRIILSHYSSEKKKHRLKFTNTFGMDFAYMFPGTFMMGSPVNEEGRYDSEVLHRVTLTKGFYMQTTPVTQSMWMWIMGNDPSTFKNRDDNFPVEQVLWSDVQEFLKKLNKLEGKGLYRLPAEAEWEYACRSGSDTAFYFGNDSHKLGEYAWYKDNSGERTNPVAKKKPNAWGLFDMHGNIWEWCQDYYGIYSSASAADPLGPSMGSYRVIRGGSWNSNARGCRSASRSFSRPGNRRSNLGFRLVRSVK